MTQTTILRAVSLLGDATTIKRATTNAKMCAKRHDDTGFLCTRDKDHPPNHVAHTGNGLLLVEWSEA